MSDKLPALHFYPGDWWKDSGVQSLDHFHKGVWFELLLIMFDSNTRGKLLLNGKQYPSKALAKRLALSEQDLNNAIEVLTESGVCRVDSEGVLYSHRMVQDEEKRQSKINAGSAGGRAKSVKQKSSKDPSRNLADTEIEDENEDVIEDRNINNKWSGKFCNLPAIEADQLAVQTSTEQVVRAVQLVDAWVLQAEDDPQEFQIRKRKAKKGSACLSSWALSKAFIQLESEKQAKSKEKTTNGYGANHLKNLEMIAKLEAEEAAQNGQ